MAGRKLFTNLSSLRLQVTLLVRASGDPRDNAGSKVFALDPDESQWQDYGDDINVYLNGIKISAVQDGSLIAQQNIVVQRGGSLDNELNMLNAIDFTYVDGIYQITARQVS